jgi:hypothetical protein
MAEEAPAVEPTYDATVVAAPSPVDDLHRNLIVFFVPREWDEAALKQYFESYGAIESTKVMLDKTTNTSRGFGFVKFVSRKDAENAILTANGAEVAGGKRLKIQKAELGRGPPGNHSVFVAGFDPSPTVEQDLRNLFGSYGNIVKVNVLPMKEGKPKGTAFVTFEFYAEANLAATSCAQNCYLGDNWLTVKLAQQSIIAAQAMEWGKGKGKGDWGANRFSPYPMPGKGKGGKGDMGGMMGGWGAMAGGMGGAWGAPAAAAGGWGGAAQGWGAAPAAAAWGAAPAAGGYGYGYDPSAAGSAGVYGA